VRSKASSLILLDEVEKAHPRVFDLFLQVLDSGFLTDSHGVKVDFRNSLIVMTSNLGTHGIRRQKIGFGDQMRSAENEPSDEQELMSEVKRFFRPEFLNRLSAVIVFKHLGADQLAKIFKLQVQQLNKQLVSKRAYLECTPLAIEHLLASADQCDAGARGLERMIQESIIVPLSKSLMENGEVKSTYLLEWNNETQSITLLRKD